jgi:hypothetical protein
MIMGKCAERVFESIPGSVLTVVTLLLHPNARSQSTLVSVILACVSTAFVATKVAYSKDTDPECRLFYPAFYGYMGTTARAKTRCFCVLFLVHAAQVLSRTMTLSLLAATQGWWAAVYLGGDFLMFVGYKAMRRDLLYWGPGVGVPMSLFMRFGGKVFVDSTACVHWRHPLELGGLYYILNAALSQASAVEPCAGLRGRLGRICGLIHVVTQVVAFGSVALYTAYYEGEAKFEASVLYVVVGTLCLVWMISFGVLLLTMERKYMGTFISTLTGREHVMSFFVDNDGKDEMRAHIFFYNQALWRPIRPQVEAWLRLRFRTWKREQPAWFTEVLQSCIPTDMLPPRDAKRLESQAQAHGVRRRQSRPGVTSPCRTRHSRRWASIEWSTSGNTSLRPGLLRPTLPLPG